MTSPKLSPIPMTLQTINLISSDVWASSRRWSCLVYGNRCLERWSLFGKRAPAAFTHDDVIKWKHFPRHWPFVQGIHRSSVNFPHKVQRRGVLMLSSICACTSWVGNGDAGDLRRHRAHYDVPLMDSDNRKLEIHRHWHDWITLAADR